MLRHERRGRQGAGKRGAGPMLQRIGLNSGALGIVLLQNRERQGASDALNGSAWAHRATALAGKGTVAQDILSILRHAHSSRARGAAREHKGVCRPWLSPGQVRILVNLPPCMRPHCRQHLAPTVPQYSARVRSGGFASTSRNQPCPTLHVVNQKQRRRTNCSRLQCSPLSAHASDVPGYQRLRKDMAYPQLVRFWPSTLSSCKLLQQQPHTLSTHACDVLGMQVEHAQGPSAEDIQEILPRLSPKQLADAIWGFAKQGHKPTEEFMAVVVQEVHSKLDHFRCGTTLGQGSSAVSSRHCASASSNFDTPTGAPQGYEPAGGRKQH